MEEHTGVKNTTVGTNAMFSNTTGSNNIALGYQAGLSLTTGSKNIDIGNVGVAAESNTSPSKQIASDPLSLQISTALQKAAEKSARLFGE